MTGSFTRPGPWSPVRNWSRSAVRSSLARASHTCTCGRSSIASSVAWIEPEPGLPPRARPEVRVAGRPTAKRRVRRRMRDLTWSQAWRFALGPRLERGHASGCAVSRSAPRRGCPVVGAGAVLKPSAMQCAGCEDARRRLAAPSSAHARLFLLRHHPHPPVEPHCQWGPSSDRRRARSGSSGGAASSRCRTAFAVTCSSTSPFHAMKVDPESCRPSVSCLPFTLDPESMDLQALPHIDVRSSSGPGHVVSR